MLETVIIFAFVAGAAVLATAGWVLFLYFWARGLPRGTRSLAAALLGSVSMLAPIWLLGSEGATGEELAVMFLVMGVLAGILGMPTALLANRKLDRIGADPAAVFE